MGLLIEMGALKYEERVSEERVSDEARGRQQGLSAFAAGRLREVRNRYRS